MIFIREGIKGIRFAAERDAVIVIVDALRASATISALFHCGVREVFVVNSVEKARILKTKSPHSILVGEKNALKPEDFDHGNSPASILDQDLEGKTCIFTSTNGARLLLEAAENNECLVGCLGNVTALSDVLQQRAIAGKDVVIIAAGDREEKSDEDMVSAAVIAEATGPDIEPQQELLIRSWLAEITNSSLEDIFCNSIHGKELLELDRAEDIKLCSQPDIFATLPRVDSCQIHKDVIFARLKKARPI